MSNHVLIALLILSLAAGTTSLIVLLAAYRASGSRPLGLFALFSACLLLMALRTLAVDYLSLNTASRLTAGIVAAFYYAPNVVTALIVGVPALIAHDLFGSPVGKGGDAAVVAATAILGLLMLTPLYGYYDAERSALVFGPASRAIDAILLAIALYAVVVSIVRFRRLDAELAPMVGRALVAFVAFLPLLGFDLFYSPAPNASGATPFLPSFFPIFLVALAIGSVVYGLRYLSALASRASAPASGAGEPLMESLDSRLADAATDKGLTARELQVARIALRGASSKEIARELRISKRTADNHLYRLYRKLGIESRYELVSLLSRPSRSE